MAQGTNAPAVDLGRITLTEMHLKAMEQALYQAADVINRLKQDGVPYTKLVLPQGGQ